MRAVNRRVVLAGMAGGAAAAAMPVGSAVGSTVGAVRRDPIRTVRLTTEHLVNPLGIDAHAPRFGWQLDASGVDRAQSAYQIVVASTPRMLFRARPDVWDTGKVMSSEQTAQVYGGPRLQSRTRYHWAVRAWDERGRPGPWSRPAWFETALMSPDEWTAQWIGSGIVLPTPVRLLSPSYTEPLPLRPGHTLGQRFDSTSPLAVLAFLLEVGAEPSGCVATLRQGGPDGDVLARQTLADLSGDAYGQSAQGRMEFAEPIAPGTLYLELSKPHGSVSWTTALGGGWTDDADAYEDGTIVDNARRHLDGIPPDPPPNPLLRREFDLSAPVISARLYIVGLGNAIAWINGSRVGDAELSPATTDFDRRILYTSHDVTAQLHEGANAIGIALGRGLFASRVPDSDGVHLAPWVAEPQVKAQLEVTLANGRRVVVDTDPNWQLTEGPTTYEAAYAGESYDARRAAELHGWTTTGYDDTDWRAAAVVDSPGGRLQAAAVEPVRAEEPIRPIAVTQPAEGVRLVDFGVVMTGWVRLRGRLPRGTTVRMLLSEKLGADGRINVGTPGGAHNVSVVDRFQVDEYTAAGDRIETWRPAFSYKGFRYAEVTGTTEPLDFVAVPVRNDVADTMRIEVGDPVLQWIADAFRQTARNGQVGHPNIAPMYGKLAWLGATNWATQPMLYQFGMAGLFAKWLDDIRLGQRPDGGLSLVTPLTYLGESFGAAYTPTSTATYPSLVRRYWLTYGDRTIPERHFGAVRRYVNWLLGGLVDGLADDLFGDWFPPDFEFFPGGEEGGKIVGTAYVIESLRDGVALADLVGEPGEARVWRERIDQLTRRFNAAFFDSGDYRTGLEDEYRQTSNAVALAFGLVPPQHVDAVAANLAADIEARGRHLNTGNVGTSALPFALSDNGLAHLAHAVFTKRSYPSYGYLRDLGATTFWESWEADSRGNNDTTLSSPVTWLVERVVGVAAIEPGWARFRVAPASFAELPHARARLDTPRGRVDVRWRRTSHGVVLDVQVPVNATAEVVLPTGARHELGSGRHRLEVS